MKGDRMGKLLKTIVFAIIYLIISYFLALQIAWLLSFNFDIIALSQQPKLFGLFSFTMDPNIMFWQGNTNYFKLASIIILFGITYHPKKVINPIKIIILANLK